MTSSKDAKGYYARLGVTPSASADDIKKAYRRLAKEMHPDLSKDKSAKTRFQEINEAYAALSDPELRSKYDALQYTNPEPQKREAELEPICCSRCGKITAQPRSTVFYRVVSLVLLTTRTPIQGIFCSTCAKKAALQASLVSAFFGWWGFPWGPIWTIASICRNSAGGQYSKDVDEKLLWYNALAFLRRGKPAIAYALAQQARTARDTEIAINAVKLIDHLRGLGVPAGSLKNPWSVSPAIVFAHLALLCVVPGAIALAAYSDDAKRSVSLSSPRASALVPRPTLSTPNGTQTVSTQSVNATARAPTCPFPPRNGQVLVNRGVWGNEGHRIEIRNGASGNAIVKVRNAYTGALLISFFVAQGNTASVVNIPDGNYRIQYALGDELGMDCRSFLKVISARQFPDVDSFETTRTFIGTSVEIGHSELQYTLFSVPHGNVRPQTLDIASFNSD